ncbi:hypothetical protein HDU76_011693, partial [Blyttiomyces sp. JEL0837]
MIRQLVTHTKSASEANVVERFEFVTVLHLDVVSFTVLSSGLDPGVLIARLNALFSAFDKICRAHQVEKILTIGDAFVAACLEVIDEEQQQVEPTRKSTTPSPALDRRSTIVERSPGIARTITQLTSKRWERRPTETTLKSLSTARNIRPSFAVSDASSRRVYSPAEVAASANAVCRVGLEMQDVIKLPDQLYS